MSGLSKTFSGESKPVLKNIYLSFFYGAKIGILGLNGSGKSTLLKIIAGIDKNFQGDITFLQDYSVGMLEQEPILDDDKTVLEIVKEGVGKTVAILDEYNAINDQFGLEEVYSNADKMQKLMDRQSVLQDMIDASNAWELDTKLEIAMDALRTPSSDKKIKNLSGGERRRVALCRLLLQEPDVLLLDEPMAGMGVEETRRMTDILLPLKNELSILLVEHDMDVIFALADRITVLVLGKSIATDTPENIRKNVQVRAAYLGDTTEI